MICEDLPSYTLGDRTVIGELLILCHATSMNEIHQLFPAQTYIDEEVRDEAGNLYATRLYTEDGALVFQGDSGNMVLRCISSEIWTALPGNLTPEIVKLAWLNRAGFYGSAIPGLHVCSDNCCYASVVDVHIWSSSDQPKTTIPDVWRVFNDAGSIADLLNFYWEIDSGRLPDISEGERYQRGLLLVSGVNGKTRRRLQSAIF